MLQKSVVRENVAQEKVDRNNFYRKCCTDNIVQEMLYGKDCTGKCFTEDTVQGNVVQKNVVQEMLYGEDCTKKVVPKVLHRKMLYIACCT